MRIVCWQMILVKYHSLLGKMSQNLSSARPCCSRDWQTIFVKYHSFLGKMLQNLLSAAVVIGALRVIYKNELTLIFLFLLFIQ